MENLPTKRILLGITGGIAAYKSCELVRQLKKAGHNITVVMSKAATEFIHPNTFQALSGNPVYLDTKTQNDSSKMAHIELTRDADIFLIAPATANMIAKIAQGICDDLISTLVAARNCPLAIAPAMNTQMWQNPANQRNLAQLKTDNIHILGPNQGEQACGETGLGRMLEAIEILDLLPKLWLPQTLQGKNIVLTAGATFEAIDPVRGLTNISSGKMGYALARTCRNYGANVTLISGQSALTPPQNIQFIRALSAAEMFEVVCAHTQTTDIFISVAAVSDYQVKNKREQKFKKSAKEATPLIELIESKDILAFVANLPNAPFCVGFAAESENLLAHARAKRSKKHVPMLVANLVEQAMGKDENQIIILDDNGEYPFNLMSKEETANIIVTHLISLINPENKEPKCKHRST